MTEERDEIKCNGDLCAPNTHSTVCNTQHPLPPHYGCTRDPGHDGPHIACATDECNLAQWEDE